MQVGTWTVEREKSWFGDLAPLPKRKFFVSFFLPSAASRWRPPGARAAAVAAAACIRLYRCGVCGMHGWGPLMAQVRGWLGWCSSTSVVRHSPGEKASECGGPHL
ncbi:hypothetical protein Zmor_025872 [Zophobas morio]|uniref:Uncharacterized protein n=1 Tax=Zophobas morio TaxID=2755281 RepID=A0AA38HT12_9CUCU|nr:hypothetical protein Zmor_025872 [Zophobas morio]